MCIRDRRWDGRGYPDGLSGHDIPPGSRVIAVADSLDAMMSSRSYRPAMTSAACRREIEKNSGIMYDPVSYTHLDVYKRQVLIGASKTQQILDNIKAVEHTTFTPDELAVIDRISK